MSTQEFDDELRPAQQVALLAGQIQYLSSCIDKLNADMRVLSKADELNERDYDYLDFDDMHEDGRRCLQQSAHELKQVYERLSAWLNRRDAVTKADADITSGTLEHLPEKTSVEDRDIQHVDDALASAEGGDA